MRFQLSNGGLVSRQDSTSYMKSCEGAPLVRLEDGIGATCPATIGKHPLTGNAFTFLEGVMRVTGCQTACEKNPICEAFVFFSGDPAFDASDQEYAHRCFLLSWSNLDTIPIPSANSAIFASKDCQVEVPSGEAGSTCTHKQHLAMDVATARCASMCRMDGHGCAGYSIYGAQCELHTHQQIQMMQGEGSPFRLQGRQTFALRSADLPGRELVYRCEQRVNPSECCGAASAHSSSHGQPCVWARVAGISRCVPWGHIAASKVAPTAIAQCEVAGPLIPILACEFDSAQVSTIPPHCRFILTRLNNGKSSNIASTLPSMVL